MPYDLERKGHTSGHYSAGGEWDVDHMSPDKQYPQIFIMNLQSYLLEAWHSKYPWVPVYLDWPGVRLQSCLDLDDGCSQQGLWQRSFLWLLNGQDRNECLLFTFLSYASFSSGLDDDVSLAMKQYLLWLPEFGWPAMSLVLYNTEHV